MASTFKNYYRVSPAEYAIEVDPLAVELGFDPNFPDYSESSVPFTNEFLGFGSNVPVPFGEITLPELNPDPLIRDQADTEADNNGFVRAIPDLGFGGISIDYSENLIEELQNEPGVDPDIFNDIDWDALPRGWGEPDPPGDFDGSSLGLFSKGQLDIADNGGDVVTLNIQLKRIFSDPNAVGPMGPFIVTLQNEADNIRYPTFSGVANQGIVLYSNLAQNKLYFCTNPMPQGRYQINLQYRNGEGIWNNIYINNSLLVVHRNRNDRTMGTRAALPSFWNAGERSDNFTPPVPYIKGIESNAAVITSAISESTNYMIDSDYTITTEELFPVAEPGPADYIIEVESTKGMPSFGQVNIGGDVYDYEVKTDRLLTLNEYTTGQIKKRLPVGTKVNYNHREWSEIENIYKRQNFNLQRPGFEISDTNWYAAFRRVWQGAFNTQPVLFNYFFHLFRALNIRFVATLTSDGIIQTAPIADYDEIYDALPFDIQDNLKQNLRNRTLNRSHERRAIVIQETPIFDLERDSIFYTNGSTKTGFGLEENDSAYWRGLYEYHDLNENGFPIDADGNIIVEEDLRIQTASDAGVERTSRLEAGKLYFCEILPWFWKQDWDGRFTLEIDDSVLDVLLSFIDNNYIDFDIFLDSTDQEGSRRVSADLGLNDFLSSGVIGMITKRRRGGNFGTHALPNSNPALVEVDLETNFILEETE